MKNNANVKLKHRSQKVKQLGYAELAFTLVLASVTTASFLATLAINNSTQEQIKNMQVLSTKNEVNEINELLLLDASLCQEILAGQNPQKALQLSGLPWFTTEKEQAAIEKGGKTQNKELIPGMNNLNLANLSRAKFVVEKSQIDDAHKRDMGAFSSSEFLYQSDLLISGKFANESKMRTLVIPLFYTKNTLGLISKCQGTKYEKANSTVQNGGRTLERVFCDLLNENSEESLECEQYLAKIAIEDKTIISAENDYDLESNEKTFMGASL